MYNAIIIFAVFAGVEKLFRGYNWPTAPHWILRGIFWLVFIELTSRFVVAALHDVLQPRAPFDLSFLGLWAIPPAFLLYEFLVYFVHRALHRNPYLWRIHQHHHSSERLDIWSAFRTHPLEIPIFALVGITVSAGVLGITEQAAYWNGLLILTIQVFEHTNVRTPRWLGYIIARPENHMLHHARDHHTSNYADFPLVDMLFGTFEAPEEAPEQVGFWDGASQQVTRLMLFQDVAEDKPQPKTEHSL